MQQCGRCGWIVDGGDPRFCSTCSDGIADGDRVRELVDGIREGSVTALGLLAEICDPAAFDTLVELAGSKNPYLRRAAVSSLGYIGDRRALPVILGLVDDTETMVRRAVVEALAELGSDQAEAALATFAESPELGDDARKALVWLGSVHAPVPDFDEIVEKLADPKIWQWEMARATWTEKLGQIGDLRALDLLTELMDQVRAYETWQGVDIVYAVGAMDLPEGERVLRRWADFEDSVGRIARNVLGEPLDPTPGPEPIAADKAARTVTRWAMQPRPVSEPITGLVTKFGGEPVWRDAPTWPLSASSGLPMIFHAQFRLPREVAGDGTWMAYLFLSTDAETFLPDGGENALVVQPGPPPRAVETIPEAIGPTYLTALWDRSRFRTRLRRVRQEYAVDLAEGYDPKDWTAEVIEDHQGDWNKLAGRPRWLQGSDEVEGSSFAFQFTPSAFGTEFGDGAEAYGFVSPTGRGTFLWQCH